jgi:hypothetical protein
VFFAGILLFGLLAMTARNAVDPDLWWHLRTGQWIIETRNIPLSDPFSFTRASQPWVSHEWLSEVVFYEIWEHAGASGLIVVSAIATMAGFLLLYLRCPGEPHWAAAATALGALASAPAWGVRPQMFTFLLASLLLWLLERGQAWPWLLASIPPLFLIWLNLHAGFALGPVLIIAYGAGLIWEAAAGEAVWNEVRPCILKLLLVLLACAALVPLNPSGTQLYRYPVDVLRSAAMRSLIVEWHSPDFHSPLYLPLLVLLLLLLMALALLSWRPKGRVVFPLLGTLLAALDAVRHIPVFVLLAIPLVAAALPHLSRPWPFPAARRPAVRLAVPFEALILVLLAIFATAQCVNLSRHQAENEARLFPSKAVQALLSSPAPRSVFAYYDWGGYVLWKLYPGYRVFVDGRADLYGADLLHQFQTTVQLGPGWRQVFREWNVATVLVPPACALAQALSLDPAWHAQYRDAQAVLFLRNDVVRANASVQETASIGPKKSSQSPPESAKLSTSDLFRLSGPE